MTKQFKQDFDWETVVALLFIGSIVGFAFGGFVVSQHVPDTHVAVPVQTGPASPTLQDGFHPSCARYENVTRSLEPPQKAGLIGDASNGCRMSLDECVTHVVPNGVLTECGGINESCLQDKTALIDEQYPTFHYNETVCVQETLVRDLPVPS